MGRVHEGVRSWPTGSDARSMTDFTTDDLKDALRAVFLGPIPVSVKVSLPGIRYTLTAHKAGIDRHGDFCIEATDA